MSDEIQTHSLAPNSVKKSFSNHILYLRQKDLKKAYPVVYSAVSGATIIILSFIK